jgi:ferredoxin
MGFDDNKNNSKDDADDATRGSTIITLDVYDGETLRTAALRRGIVSPHNGAANLINCRGLGTCGTCAVEIVKGVVDPPLRNAVEEFRLSLPPHSFHDNNKLRLACQIQIHQNVSVVKRTGFWGQRDQVAMPSAPRRYFGEFEYLLDNKSPPPQEPVDTKDTY